MIEKHISNGWEYYIEDGVATIIGIPETSKKELFIPETLDGHPVEEIKFYFANVRDYTSIMLPRTTKRFDAICLAETIESISVDSRNEYFLSKNDILYSKDSKTIVAFPPAKKVFMISCLDGVEIIGDGAFSCCDCITDITLPKSITKNGDFAFEGCEQLNCIDIPDSVKSIGAAVFAHSSVQIVHLPQSIKNLDAAFDYDAEGEGFFEGCNIEKIVLPHGVERIGHLAFSYCEQLKEIYIPRTVAYIDETAFMNCYNLR